MDRGYNSTAPQIAYNTLVSSTPCASTLSSGDSLSCLRALPFSIINKALNISTFGLTPFAPAIDGDLIATYPSSQLSSGAFVRVPLLIGTNSDEGTAFGSAYWPNGLMVNSDDEFLSVLNSTNLIPETSKTAAIIQYLYPNIQALGIPSFTTYPEVIEPNSTAANSVGLQYRRIAAYFGDIVVTAPRRASNIAWSTFNVPSYAYRFDVTVNGVPAITGATHFEEVAFVFDNTAGAGYATDPFAGTPISSLNLAKQMSRSWVAFITQLNPNMNGCRGANQWPIYNTSSGAGMDYVFTINGSSHAEEDTWRGEGIAFISDNALGVYGR